VNLITSGVKTKILGRIGETETIQTASEDTTMNYAQILNGFIILNTHELSSVLLNEGVKYTDYMVLVT
jgi:hypothetical protein